MCTITSLQYLLTILLQYLKPSSVVSFGPRNQAKENMHCLKKHGERSFTIDSRLLRTDKWLSSETANYFTKTQYIIVISLKIKRIEDHVKIFLSYEIDFRGPWKSKIFFKLIYVSRHLCIYASMYLCIY